MSVLAKLSAPRLFDVAPRERLFSALDHARSHPVVWVEGPPGAGKTSLVASFLEARGIPSSWYQVDAGDGDAATLFFYLGQILGQKGADAPRLPLFTPEYLPDPGGFSRRYFRAFFAHFGPSRVLVFDNFQEAVHSPAFVTAIRAALAELPHGTNVMLLSRTVPPLAFARLQTTGAIAVLDWAQLTVTEDEAAQIAGLEPGPGTVAARDLVRACGGWVAGLTLMLAHGVAPEAGLAGRPREEVFRFFAAEILERADGTTRDFLLRSWVLPRMTAHSAAEVTGCTQAGIILDRLYRSNYFVERRFDAEPNYQYHALFRSFLHESACAQLGDADIAALRMRAADRLGSAGQLDDAIRLYGDAGASDQAARLIAIGAPDMYAQGRIETLSEWLAQVPAQDSPQAPILEYWRGMCELARDPARARTHFARAHRDFAAQDDTSGRARAATGIVDSLYVEWSDFSRADPWIDELAGLLQGELPFAGPPDEMRVVAATLVAMLYRQPCHRLLPALANRVRAQLETGLETNLCVTAGTFLLNYWNWVGKPDEARNVIALVSGAAQDPVLTPLRLAWWLLRCAYHDYVMADHDNALGKLDQVERLAGEHGLRVVDDVCQLYRTFVYLNRGDTAAATAVLDALDQRLDPARRLDTAIAAFLHAWRQALQGDWPGMARSAESAARIAQHAGVPNVEGYFAMLAAIAAAEQGRHESAQALLARAGALTSTGCYPLYGFAFHLAGAYMALLRGDEPACVSSLRDGFRIGAREGYLNALWWLPRMMSTLCAEALARDIEPDYLLRLIRVRGLSPPQTASTAWPWELRVVTLGAFRVERRGKPLEFSGKAQKKPLALLMALVAFGGRDVHTSRLSGALWPDADGDAARNALGTTLFRLRHLLDCEDALHLAEGKLSLNPDRVWVDAWALDSLVATITTGERTQRQRQLLSIYRGHFLDREEDTPWMLAPRERLRGLFLRAVETLGAQAEQAQDWAAAEQIYRSGIAADLLAESLYRHLMLCCRQLGRIAEALDAYRHCRQALSVALGIAPSAETEAVRRTLG